MLPKLVIAILLASQSYAIWIGEEYWTTIDYLGGLKDGRTISDFLDLPNADNSSVRGWVAYWITRTRYPSIHYEAFGHAVRRHDGRICGYFVGHEQEVVEVCGGFRVLSRNRNERYDQRARNPFQWVIAHHAHAYETVGFVGHRIASYRTFGQTVYGDGLLEGSYRGPAEYKGAAPERIEEKVITVTGHDFRTQVYFLRKLSPEVGPDRTGSHINDPYYDPHLGRHPHSNGHHGHPDPRRPYQPQIPVPPQPRPKAGCMYVRTSDGRLFESCPEQTPHDPSRVDPSDKRLQDPRSNPNYEYYDPLFDPRSPLYDPRYNPYDPQYDPEKDRLWREAQGLGSGGRNPPAPLPPREEPTTKKPEEKVPVRVFRPGPVIPKRPPTDQNEIGRGASPEDEGVKDREDDRPDIGEGTKPDDVDITEREDDRPEKEGKEVDIGEGARPDEEDNREGETPDEIGKGAEVEEGGEQGDNDDEDYKDLERPPPPDEVEAPIEREDDAE